MLTFLNTVKENELYTMCFNNKWRILDNSGNTMGYESKHALEHLNSINELFGVKYIVLF